MQQNIVEIKNSWRTLDLYLSLQYFLDFYSNLIFINWTFFRFMIMRAWNIGNMGVIEVRGVCNMYAV